MDTDFEYLRILRILKLNEFRVKYTHNVGLRIEIYKYLLRQSEKKDEDIGDTDRLRLRVCTAIANEPFYVGKVRELYDVTLNSAIWDKNDMVGMKISDRLSGFDRFLCNVPMKGLALNSISSWWFQKTNHFVPNHIVYDKFNYVTLVRKCKVFPIEFVVRGYMTGSTQTSIWQNYKKGMENNDIKPVVFCGHSLRLGYKKNEKLDENILTPTTKSNIHDRPISKAEIIEEGIMSQKHWDICEKYALALFEFGQKTCEERGLILVDTKYEFGLDSDGNVVIVDELHTPDSSRYWISHNYTANMQNGIEPDHIDKEFIRKWVKKTYEDPYKEGLEIVIPEDKIMTLSSRYLMLHEMITGEELEIY
jgi:phosphoribosylaminoimidazole-succinocarboxamide synthase